MPPRHRPDLTEWMDHPDVDPRELAANLRDLRRFNALLGWRRGARRTVRRLTQPGGASTRVLDIATGSADIPLALAGSEGTIEVWATDGSSRALQVAASRDEQRRLRLALHDARHLPFTSGAFDIAMINLALHHFPPADATRVLAELGRVARRVLVNDLERSWFAYAFARLTPVVTRNRLTRHDGPMSVLRAYTHKELAALGSAAGLADVEVRSMFPARLVMTARGSGL